jgi:hypothetical protein
VSDATVDNEGPTYLPDGGCSHRATGTPSLDACLSSNLRLHGRPISPADTGSASRSAQWSMAPAAELRVVTNFPGVANFNATNAEFHVESCRRCRVERQDAVIRVAT